MLGAIIGDIVGSRFERYNHRSKEFELFTEDCTFTDDTVMTLAVAKAIMESRPDFSDLEKQTVIYMQGLGRLYPYCGYGGRFYRWLFSSRPRPYHSFGNGSAMRVSACAEVAGNAGVDGLTLTKVLSHKVTEVTHNHPEGYKGAEAIAVAAYLARTGVNKEDIRKVMDEEYYKVDFTLDEIRESYEFSATCQGSVPQALAAFYESTDFEDAIRNAVSVGGDSDTIAAMAGTIAEAYYGIPAEIQLIALTFLDERLLSIYEQYQEWRGANNADLRTLEEGKVLHGLSEEEVIDLLAEAESDGKVN